MAFGDGYNDIELLTRADYSFAVRNAVQEIKNIANYITRSNDEDEVMKTILKSCLYKVRLVENLIKFYLFTSVGIILCSMSLHLHRGYFASVFIDDQTRWS